MPTPDPNPSSPNDDKLPLPALDQEMLDLERRLEDLVPAAPRSGWIDAAIDKGSGHLSSDGQKGAESVGQRGWLKFAPLGMAAVVMITGGFLASRLERSPAVDVGGAARAPEVAATESQLVSISMENALRETELEDVVEVEGYGLMRPVMFHFETAQCWIDTETETSVQVIRPWQELVLYPVDTY